MFEAIFILVLSGYFWCWFRSVR